MIRVIRAEWRKLRRPTLFLGTIGAALFFTGLFTSLLFILIDSPRGNSDPANPISREMLASVGGSVIGFSNVAGLLGIIAYCVFAAQTAQESHRCTPGQSVLQRRRLPRSTPMGLCAIFWFANQAACVC